MTQALQSDQHKPAFIGGLEEIANNYDTFILDVWGVIHDGIKPFPGTVRALTSLKASGKDILMLSNTPDRSHVIADSLMRMGISSLLYDHILTAGESAWLGLAKRPDQTHKDLGSKCFCPGRDFRKDENGNPFFFHQLDLDYVQDASEATFFLNACGGFVEDEDNELEPQWEQTRQALDAGLPMICVNPDLVVNVGEEKFICAGTFAKWYEENGGSVLYHGKPHAPIYEMAWSLLGKPNKARMVAIGDSLHTDIQGANNFGIDSIFNLTGIHQEEVQTGDDSGVTDTAKLMQMIDAQPHKPNAILSGLQWASDG